MGTAMRAFFVVLLLGSVAAGQELVPTGVEVGTTLPNLAGVDVKDNPYELSSVLGKGTLVLSFWSIHCTDCIRELDDLRAIRKEFPPEEVTLIAVNTDSGIPVTRVANFLQRYEAARAEPLAVVHLLDRNTRILDALGIRYIPLLIVADRTGRVTSIVTGYSPQDRPQLGRAMEQGRLALGAWGEGLRAKLRTLLRAQGAQGREIEWGSFRVEEGMPLFGLYDAKGWLSDVVGRRDRAAEVRRVESAIGGRLRISLLREALTNVGVKLPLPGAPVFQTRGIEVPENLLEADGPWKRLYEAVGFDRLHREQGRSATWVGDEYWAGLLADVDLGSLRERLASLGIPERPAKIRLAAVSDFDFKPRAVFKALQQLTYRLQSQQGEDLLYYGDANRLAEEIRSLNLPDFKVYVEVVAPDAVRLEVY